MIDSSSIFRNNFIFFGSGGGGAINAYSLENALFFNTTFDSNTATNGGGMALSSEGFLLQNCTWINNKGNAAGLLIASMAPNYSQYGDIDSCIFDSNDAFQGMATMHVLFNTNNNIVVSFFFFFYFFAGSGGGAVFQFGIISMKNNVFKSNRALSVLLVLPSLCYF